MKIRNLKRIVALIAALSMLLCSSALAKGIFDPETLVSTYNDALVPILTEFLGDANAARAVADEIRLEYSESSSSSTGSVYYWNKDYSFSINFTAKDRYSTAEFTSVYMSFDNEVTETMIPLLLVSLAVGHLVPDMDSYAFYQWIFDMDADKMFECDAFTAHMSIADDGSYMGFSMFPN